MGGAAVGQQVISQTTHVFYVNQTIATEFETGLTAIGFTGGEGGPTGNSTSFEETQKIAQEALAKAKSVEAKLAEKQILLLSTRKQMQTMYIQNRSICKD